MSRRAGRFAEIEAVVEKHTDEIGRLAADAAAERVPGPDRELIDGLGDRADIGPDRRHPFRVLKTEQRYVFGKCQLERVDRLHRAEGRVERRGEDCGWTVGAAQI